MKRFNMGFLKDSVEFWLSEKASRDPNTNVLYYPYHMILGYDIGRNVHKAHLKRFFNEKAREVIEKRLIERKLFSDRREYFDYTLAHPSDWHSTAHQNTPVKHVYFDPRTYYIPQFQALGDYSLGALAKGYTTPREGGGHSICITNAYSFVNDSFDFRGFQWLGTWDFENSDFSADLISGSRTKLYNSTFRDFARRTKYGRDFRVVSPLYEVPLQELNFRGKEIIDNAICWKVAK